MQNKTKPLEEIQFLTIGQIAKLCCVAPRTVVGWVDSGELKGFRLPGSRDRRVDRENFIEFLDRVGMKIEGFNKNCTEKNDAEIGRIVRELISQPIDLHIVPWVHIGKIAIDCGGHFTGPTLLSALKKVHKSKGA